jgi:glycosyltransferase involved in cell wall biosynthesis
MRTVATRWRWWDVNIFLERLVPEYFATARVNCLFPHQEWLTEGDRNRLREVDLVLFKTKHAEEILRAETRASAFVGFSTSDRGGLDRPGCDAALHVAGWNPHKGTTAVTTAWAANPDWPELRLVSQLPVSAVAPNIRHLRSRIGDSALRVLQNECRVHVCPSEVEGFGHTLVEALSCGAITVTTDAPPMNELITPDEGILVPYASTLPMGAGTRYLVSPQSLNDAVKQAWTLTPGICSRMSQAARRKFEELDAAFKRRLSVALDGI